MGPRTGHGMSKTNRYYGARRINDQDNLSNLNVTRISDMDDLNKLWIRIESALPRMKGQWVGKASGYEPDFARCIGADLKKTTYWDMEVMGLRIEVKKGQTGGWFDLIRYCHLPKEGREVLTLFLHYDKVALAVRDVFIITMGSLIEALQLNRASTAAIDRVRTLLHPSKDSRLNFQSRLTTDELRRIAGHPPNLVISLEGRLR